MSLDIFIFSDGQPMETVSLNPDLHWAIFGDLSEELALACRLSDYYEKAKFTPDEALQLIPDLQRIKQTRGSAVISPVIDELIELARAAGSRHLPIFALPD